jgi:hypothetical protein
MSNPSGSQDNNLKPIVGSDSGIQGTPRRFDFEVIDASDPQYTGALKITDQVHDVDIYVDKIIGGRETCVDINNRAERIRIFAKEYAGNPEYIFTVKGGASDIELHGAITGTSSKGCALNLGDWSDQSSAITSNIKLFLSSANQPITYRRLNATDPVIITQALYKCVLSIPFGALGISVVWAIWGLLKKLKLA